jgi:hypothetical protein
MAGYITWECSAIMPRKATDCIGIPGKCPPKTAEARDLTCTNVAANTPRMSRKARAAIPNDRIWNSSHFEMDR